MLINENRTEGSYGLTDHLKFDHIVFLYQFIKKYFFHILKLKILIV